MERYVQKYYWGCSYMMVIPMGQNPYDKVLAIWIKNKKELCDDGWVVDLFWNITRNIAIRNVFVDEIFSLMDDFPVGDFMSRKL
jgi:hypothetical protein